MAELDQDCDECGKRAIKIKRIYKEHRYCSTCYARVFKRRLCLACGNFAHLPKHDPSAVCRRCQSNKPCVRCRKADYDIGKVTPYGPVCNACARYFNEPKACGLCGKPSIHLSRVTRLGLDVQVCPQCGRQDHHACKACGRHRLLIEAPDGRALCQKCFEFGEIPCSKCGVAMPAGYGKQCRQCDWKTLLEKRIKMDCASLSSPEMAKQFEAFGQWLGRKVGVSKAASTIHRYLAFFADIDRQWESIPAYHVLLARFGTLRLRRALLPVLWMQEQKLIVPDADAKKEDSEKRRIATILKKIPAGSVAQTILTGYHKSLQARLVDGEITLLSIRLALTPAVTVLQLAQNMACVPPDQKVIDAYLKNKPGQRAAIYGFVIFLRERYQIDIVLPKVDAGKAKRRRKKLLEAEMLDLMKEPDNKGDRVRRWLVVSLAYFHELPKKVGKELKSDSIVANEDGSWTVEWKSQLYWVPKMNLQLLR